MQANIYKPSDFQHDYGLKDVTIKHVRVKTLGLLGDEHVWRVRVVLTFQGHDFMLVQDYETPSVDDDENGV